MQSCACGRSGGVCSDKFARMRQLLSVAAGLIGGRSNYARGLARRLAGPEASAKTGALRRGVERREDAPRAFPSRDRGPAAPRAGAPREPSRGTPWSAVAGEIRAPAHFRVEQFALSLP